MHDRSPLVVIWANRFQVDYAAIGLIMAVTAVASAVSVVPVGVLTDRMPARRVLIAGLSVVSLSTVGFGLAQSYAQLLVCAVLAGLGNSVFHPCGYKIISAAVPGSVAGPRIQHPHLCRPCGLRAGPALVGLAILYWNWRDALILLARSGLPSACLMLVNRRALDDGHAVPARPDPAEDDGARLLLSPAILMCFHLFPVHDGRLPGASTASCRRPLFEHRGIPETQGTFALTVFFGFSALGILAGGIVADRTTRHGRTAASGFVVAATCIFLIGDGGVGTAAIFGLIALAGLGAGIVTPSRDLIVRKLTPAAQTGKVFAFMTLAMDAGSFVAPPVFGFLMDEGHTVWLFRLAAAMLLLSILTVTATRRLHRLEQTA